MATYKTGGGAVLYPGDQINRLSGYNQEGVFGWPGVEAYEVVGYVPITGTTLTKTFTNITVPSPDRRVDDRVRDNLTSLVVPASTAQPSFIYGASIAIAQDIPSGSGYGTGALPGFPGVPLLLTLLLRQVICFCLVLITLAFLPVFRRPTKLLALAMLWLT